MNSQVTCDTCGETISGEVFGQTLGMRLCGECADERRERQWEHMGDDEMHAYFTPVADRFADESDQVDEEMMLDRRDAGEDASETDSGEQPASEFSPEVIKRLEFVRWQIATGLIEP